MYEEKDECYSDCVTETRYRRLSHQLFGEPNCCKGPFIDINRKSPESPDQALPQVSKKIRRKKAVKRSPKCTKTKDLKRCLICYSDITQVELLDDQGKKESFEHLTEFLRIMRSPITTLNLNGNQDELNDDYNYNAVLELSVKQLETTSSCLCSPCNAACQNLVKVHRHMRKLEQEVKEFQVKFLNAIMLSKAIAEKFDKAIGKLNQDEEEGDYLAKTALDMVDQVRTFLVGGKWIWNSMKDKWMDYVHLDNEFTGHLHEPFRSKYEIQNKLKTKQRKQKILKPSTRGTSIVKIVKGENDKLSPNELEISSLGLQPGPQRDVIETRSMTDDETTKSDSCFDYDNDDAVGASLPGDNEDSMKVECDSVGHEEIPIDIKRVSVEMDPQEEKRTTATDSVLKRKKAYHGHVGVAHPFSFVHKPPDQLPTTSSGRSRRRLRAKYPNLSTKEFVLLRKGLPKGRGRARVPIEELKSTSSANKSYIKWRESHHSKTMSIPAYKKMRRELALQRQKIMDEKGTFMPDPKDSVLPVRWVEKDGKLRYLGFEVNKHEDATMSCFLCPDFNTTYRQTMSRHIKRNHIEGTRTLACDQCDAKFIWRSKLKNHVQEKHGGAYVCDICGLTLSNRSGLYNHVRFKHDGVKPHVCEHCGKGFGRKKDMVIHVRRHTGERPFVCHVCADTFIEKQSMKKHIRTKHPGEPTDEGYKPPQNFVMSKPIVEKTSSSETDVHESN